MDRMWGGRDRKEPRMASSYWPEQTGRVRPSLGGKVGWSRFAGVIRGGVQHVKLECTSDPTPNVL